MNDFKRSLRLDEVNVNKRDVNLLNALKDIDMRFASWTSEDLVNGPANSVLERLEELRPGTAKRLKEREGKQVSFHRFHNTFMTFRSFFL